MEINLPKTRSLPGKWSVKNGNTGQEIRDATEVRMEGDWVTFQDKARSVYWWRCPDLKSEIFQGPRKEEA